MIEFIDQFLSTFAEWHYFIGGFSLGYVLATGIHHHLLPTVRALYGE